MKNLWKIYKLLYVFCFFVTSSSQKVFASVYSFEAPSPSMIFLVWASNFCRFWIWSHTDCSVKVVQFCIWHRLNIELNLQSLFGLLCTWSHGGRFELETMPLNASWSKFQEKIGKHWSLPSFFINCHFMNVCAFITTALLSVGWRDNLVKKICTDTVRVLSRDKECFTKTYFAYCAIYCVVIRTLSYMFTRVQRLLCFLRKWKGSHE
jgi:hypothetical protein